MTRERLLLRAVAVLAGGALLGLFALARVVGGTTVRTASGDSVLSVSADRRFAVWPLDCVTLRWQSTAVTRLALDGDSLPPAGTRLVCGTSRRPPAVSGVSSDGRPIAVSPALARVRVSPVACLLLLAVEFLLLDVVASNRLRASPVARVLVFVVPLAIAVALRIHQAFGTRDVLDWDETYYLNIAVTAAGGRGLYPYMLGFPAMPVMGGIGYLAYVYALAVDAWGPTIFALRALSLVASVAGIAGMWALVRRWYGSGPAWVSAALTPALSLFVLSNSARMDAWTFAWVTWSLLVFAVACERGRDVRWHVAAGLVFGLGLQAHIDITATALACGAWYLISWFAEARAAGRVVMPRPMFGYLAGWLTGLLFYLACNVAPDPAAFYRTAVLIGKVNETAKYSAGTSNVFGSFLNPLIVVAKEAARYRQLLSLVPAAEAALFFAGCVALLVRRTPADLLVRVLVPAVIGGAAIVLNTPAPVYFIHVTPLLVVPLAAVFTHGVGGTSRLSLGEVRMGSLVAFAVAISVLLAVNNARAFVRSAATPESAATAAFVDRVRSAVDRRCRIAGDGGLYVRYLADYPYFLSSRASEVGSGMLYWGLGDERAYWQLEEPDAIVAEQPLAGALAAYASDARLVGAAPGVWIRPDGCGSAAIGGASRRSTRSGTSRAPVSR